ncbi:MAG: hypothetical protein U0L52_00360 [Bacteroidaceae bacterium]|nr:hypothetical protein [Bacteroidaceae bacterium]
MNRIQNTIISVCLLALAACQSDELQIPDAEGCTLEILTSTEHATRTALLEDGKTVVWEQGDAIAVYDYIAPKKKFVAEVSEGTTRFKGNITPKNSSFLAVYPHDLCEDELQSQKVAINLPSEQTAVPGGFAPNTNLSIGKGERNVDGSPSQVTFRNICQLFKLQVPSYIDGRITKIVLATNKAIAGKLLVDYSASVPSVAVDNQESTSVTLLPPAGSTTFAEGTYYMALAPVQAEGFSLTMTDTNGKSYSQHSKQAFGGTSGVIYTLGAIDLVEQPAVTAQHVYASGVLQGTEVSLTAPVPDREWTATITNASGVTVRSLAKAAGTLKSAATDAAWPYLPKGAYTVNYTFLTANGKEMGSSVSFQITENPEFGLFQQAASSYTYYAGDEVEKNVTRANSTEAFTVTAISSSVTGISEAILNNANYSITYTNDFSGSVTASSNSAVTYADKKYSATGAYTLGATTTFDGVTKSDTKSVHITGLPYSAVPPKEGDWSGKANNWTYSKNSHQGVRLYDQQISKSFNIPANVDVNVKQDVDVHTSTVGTTYTLYAGGNSIFSLEAGGKAASENCHEDKGTYPGTLTVDNPSVACDNSYGNAPFFETYGTHLLIREITVRYR